MDLRVVCEGVIHSCLNSTLDLSHNTIREDSNCSARERMDYIAHSIG